MEDHFDYGGHAAAPSSYHTMPHQGTAKLQLAGGPLALIASLFFRARGYRNWFAGTVRGGDRAQQEAGQALFSVCARVRKASHIGAAAEPFYARPVRRPGQGAQAHGVGGECVLARTSVRLLFSSFAMRCGAVFCSHG